MQARRWTNEELDFLRENYLTKSLEEIGKHLDRTASQVKAAAKNHGINGKRKPITDEQRDTVRRLYPDTATSEIAKIIGRTSLSVYQMANKMGIKKSPEYVEKCLAECGQQVQAHGERHQFQKGQVPPNKGLRRPGWSPGRMSETQFKKGSFSPNRREIGEQRIDSDGYVWIKVADGLKNHNWKQKNWIVWEEHNGPIPEGTNIVFKDGNRQNCDIANLEAISDAALLDRNRWENYPEPVRRQIRILAGFRRRLNSYAKK